MEYFTDHILSVSHLTKTYKDFKLDDVCRQINYNLRRPEYDLH